MHPFEIPSDSENPEIRAMHKLLISSEFLSVLVEEVGEVGKALQGDPTSFLKDELIQVASVAVRWLEFLK